MATLTQELRKKYSSAIRQGFIDPAKPIPHGFCGTWLRRHPNRVTTLTRLRDILGHNPEWEDMTDDTLADLKEIMLMTMAPNSVRTICAELKAVLNSNRRSKPIKSLSFDTILRSKKVPTQNVYLDEGELTLIHEYEPRDQREAYIKEMFMRECLTGARAIDSRRLSLANIRNIDGVDYLVYVPQKHPVEVSVPVHKWLKNYLTGSWPPELEKVREDAFCGPIRNICHRVGITREVSVYRRGRSETGPKYRFVSTHTGRRTFATILSLKGCPLEQISMMMGHISGNVPNISMTSGYICARGKISNDVLTLFQ